MLKLRFQSLRPLVRSYQKWNKQQRPRNKFEGKGKNNQFQHNDRELISRNKGKSRSMGDGLLGKPDYELDTEAIKSLEWTQLVSEGEHKDSMSAVETQTLADRRILNLPLVNSLIHNRGYTSLTPVQAQTLVPILNDKSVVVRAKTGTGKTAAFSIPTIQKVLEAKKDKALNNKVKAIIISPTRELAQQIADEISKILNYGGLNHVSLQCFVGGLSKFEQLKQGGFTRGRSCCDIVVATPGRLQDILEDEDVLECFDSLIYRVFDEADRLLDIGFEGILRQIKDRIDEVDQQDRDVPLLLFSATADSNVRRFAAEQFGNRVQLIDTIPKDEPTANELVDQSLTTTSTWAEIYEGVANEIVTAFENRGEGENFKAIVFMPTVAMVDNYADILYKLLPKKRGESLVMAIHGQKSQAARQKLSDKFRHQDTAILVTTDVIARGMDFPRVSHVFQVGPPPDVPSYVHRIGRTARIGNVGKSSLFLTNHVRGYINSLSRENITPKLNNFQSDPEFRERFADTVAMTIRDPEDPHEIINSLMSYMTVLKSKYPVNPQKFVEDMLPFAQLYELDSLDLSRSNKDTWMSKPRYNNNKRGGNQNRKFGSSRKSRMRW